MYVTRSAVSALDVCDVIHIAREPKHEAGRQRVYFRAHPKFDDGRTLLNGGCTAEMYKAAEEAGGRNLARF